MNNAIEIPMKAVRIYLTFTKQRSIIKIYQTSKTLDNKIFLERTRRVRKPYEKHMRLGLAGTIQTTINAYKRKFKKNVTHVGIYVSNPLAFTILNDTLKVTYLKNKIKLIVISKN